MTIEEKIAAKEKQKARLLAEIEKKKKRVAELGTEVGELQRQELEKVLKEEKISLSDAILLLRKKN